MKRLITIGLLLAMLVGSGWWAYTHRTTINTPWTKARPSATTPHQQSNPNQADIAKLELMLNSSNGKTQLKALAPTLQNAYTAAGRDRFVPQGATLSVESSSFVAAGGMANVDATVKTTSATTGIVLVLVRIDDSKSWQVLDIQDKK